MKLWQKGIIWFSIPSFLILAIFFLIPLLSDKSWKWFFIPLGTIFVIAIFILFGVVIWYFATRKKPLIEEDIDDLKELVIKKMKEDHDNPDNFIIKEFYPISTGERGQTPTPIILFDGYGSELGERRVAVINSVKSEKWGFRINPTESEIKELVVKIADFPEEFVPEEITRYDAFGNLIGTSKTLKKPTYAEKIDEKEKKEVEDKIHGEGGEE